MEIEWNQKLIDTLNRSEIADLIKYLWQNKNTTVANLPPSAHESRVLKIISKIDTNFKSTPSGDWRQRLDSWLSQRSIRRENFLDSVLGYYHAEAMKRYIETQEESVDNKKAVRARVGEDWENGSVIYMTPFRLVVEYQNGVKVRKVRGGDIIPPPTIKDVFISIANSYSDEFAAARSDQDRQSNRNRFLASTDFTSNTTDQKYNINSEESFSEIMFEDEDFLYSYMKVTESTILQSSRLVRAASESAQKVLDQSTSPISSGITQSKYTIYSAIMLAGVVNWATGRVRLRLSPATKTAEEGIKKAFEVLDHEIHNLADFYKYIKGIAYLSKGEIIEGLLGIGITYFMHRLAHNVTIQEAVGHSLGGWIGFAIAVSFDVWIKPAIKKSISAMERESKMATATSLGWAPGPWADYGIVVPLSQFGMSPSFAIHREFLRKVEIPSTRKFSILTGDYIRENGTYWDPYEKSYIRYEFSDTEVMGNIPEGDWPLSFYPEVEVTAVNNGIGEYMNSNSYTGIRVPGPKLNADDIASLFDIETFGIVENTDWEAIAEEAAAAGFVNQSDLEGIKDYQSFMREAEKDVQLPDGSIVPNVDFEDLEKNWSENFINSTFDDFETELISGFNQMVFDENLSSKVFDTGMETYFDGNGRIVSRGDVEPARIVFPTEDPSVRNRPIKEPGTKVKDGKIQRGISKRKVIPKKRNPETKITKVRIRQLVTTPPNQRPKPKTPKNGRVLTQKERNILRSRSLKNYNGKDKNIESIINKNIPIDKAPDLNAVGTSGTGGGVGGRTGGGGGTTTGGGASAGSTCFPKYAKVHTPIGKVSIFNLSVGDVVYCFDEFDESLKILESKVTAKFEHIGEEQSDVYRYTFTDGGFIDVTKNHSVFTQNRKFEQIGNLQEGDSVLNLYGKQTTISSVKHLGKMDVYNIEVDKYHTYICDEILVHNALKTDPRLSGGGPTIEGGPDGNMGGTTGGGTTGGGTTGGGTPPPPPGGGGGVAPKTSEACFPSWSKISTPNGFVDIKDIKIGQEIISFDKNGNLFNDKVSFISYHEQENNSVYKYSLSNGDDLFITENHYVLNHRNEFVPIELISNEDYLVSENGSFVKIIEKQFLGDYPVYNILTEKFGTYISNGIRVWGSDDLSYWK